MKNLFLTFLFIVVVPIIANATQTMNLYIAGSGQGIVTSFDPGVFCGRNCVHTTGTFADNTQVMMVAKSAPGSYFAGWQGACAGFSVFCVVKMDEAKNVMAVFETRYDLAMCSSDPDEKSFFVRSPMDFASIEPNGSTPLGDMYPPDHTLPTQHMFMQVKTGLSFARIYTPADVVLTAAQYDGEKNAYYLQMQPCKDVTILYALVTDVPSWLTSQMAPSASCMGPMCIYDRLNIKIPAGTVLGKTGTSRTLALEAYDFRQPMLSYANPGRYFYERTQAVCPFDYFVNDDPRSTKSTLYNTFSSDGHVCGDVDQYYVTGSAQGDWFPNDLAPSVDDRNNLGLLHDAKHPTIPVISVGNHVPGLSSGRYTFTVQPSGSVNRDFSAIATATTPPIFCYENLSRNGSSVSNIVILMQMPDSTHLVVKKVSLSDCSTAQSTGTLATDVDGTISEYVR